MDEAGEVLLLPLAGAQPRVGGTPEVEAPIHGEGGQSDGGGRDADSLAPLLPDSLRPSPGGGGGLPGFLQLRLGQLVVRVWEAIKAQRASSSGEGF